MILKSTEVMINDIVLVYGSNSILDVQKHWYHKKVDVDWIDNMRRRDELYRQLEELDAQGKIVCNGDWRNPDIGDSVPAVVTEAFLKANGFNREVTGAYTYYFDVHDTSNNFIAVDLTPERTTVNMVTTDADLTRRYSTLHIHNLQQLIRIGGFREFADNLQV